MHKGNIASIEEVAAIINTKIRERNQKQSSDLFEFFNVTNFGEVLKNDMLLGQINLETLFFFLSQFLEIQTYEKNDVLYYEGARGEFLYLLAKGSVSLFKLKISKEIMSPLEYYHTLQNIKGKYLLEKTIRLNSGVFPVNKTSDVNEMSKMLQKVQIVLMAYHDDIDGIKEFLTKNNISFDSVEFDKVITMEMSIEEYYQKRFSLLSETEIFYFQILNEDSEKEIRIAELEFSGKVEKNEFFGNFKLGDFENKRAETAIVNEQSVIIRINKKMYSTCIINDKRNIREKEIETIHQNSFFKFMRKNFFAKNFFYELDLVEVCKNTMIYNEGDTVKEIYIVKEGTFELSIDNKNIFELKLIISNLKKLDEAFKLKEYDDVIALKNSPTALATLMKKKKNFSLFVTEKDVFGLWEYVYHSKAIYNVRAISDKAKLYRIAVKKLQREANEDFTLLQRGIKSEAAKKIKNVLERIIMLKNSVLTKIDIEYTKRTKEDEDNYYRENATVNVIKNSHNSKKVAINFNKDKINKTRTKLYKSIVTGYKKEASVFNLKQKIGLSMETILRSDLNHRNFITESRTITDEDKKIFTKLQKKKINLTSENVGTAMNSYEEAKSERLPMIQPFRISLKKRSTKKKKQTIQLNKDINLNSFLSEDLSNHVKNINYLAVRKFYEGFKPHSKKYK